MPSTFSDPSTSEYQYFLHIWREEPETGVRRLAELLGTDGERVRSLRSRGSFLTFEEVDAFKVARDLVDTIEGEWQPEAPFFGHESLSDTEMVAILHNARQIDEQWAVFPCNDSTFPAGELTEPAVTAQEGIRHHLIAGTEVGWESGEPHLQGAIEARSWKQDDVQKAAELLGQIESVELRATVERRGEIEEIGLAPEASRRVEPSLATGGRLEADFPIDSVILQKFSDQPSFQPWFVFHFSAEVFSVPELWRRFWISIDFEK